MAGIWNKLQWWCVTLVFVTYFNVCSGCTPSAGTEPKTEDKIHFSDIFAYGKVIDIYQGGYMYPTLYTVKFEVYCSFKGDALPRYINITRAGNRSEPGLCVSNRFKKGKVYYVYLAEDYSPRFNEDEEKTTEELADINLFCDVEIVNYPTGLAEKDRVVECPDPYPGYDGCIKHIPTTPTAEPTVIVKTMAPKAKPENMPADGTSNGTPEGGETGQVVYEEDGENSGGRMLMSLGVTALCVVLAVL